MADWRDDYTPNALILFVDIVESTKLGSVLSFSEYAKRIDGFQDMFEKIGRRYFPEQEDKSKNYSKVEARGDEGLIFYIEHRHNDKDSLIFRAIEFLIHIKALLFFKSLGDLPEKKSQLSPTRMGIGAGIHFGKVAILTGLVQGHSEIIKIEGYSISKAKRVESSSRVGRFSKILLSKEAANLLIGSPVVLEKVTTPMKGIEEHAELHEVKSGLFSGLKLIEGDTDTEDNQLIQNAIGLAGDPEKISESWVKSLVISILDIKLRNAFSQKARQKYKDYQLKIAWDNLNEDDPILLYIRARDYQEKYKYTQQIRYLRQILKMHPEFVFARKRMVEACWRIAELEDNMADKVYARDVAEEFLEKFPEYLLEDEKSSFNEIVENLKQK